MATKSILRTLKQWLDECRQGGKISRNTIAVGIVVLNHLRKNCPVSQTSVFSRGGELVGARSALGKTLEEYGVPATFLREVTNRQAGPSALKLFEALDWGRDLVRLPTSDRDRIIKEGIRHLSGFAHAWLERQHLKVNCDRQLSPIAWVGAILQQAKGRSGGKVEQHLVGAKLEKRFPQTTIPNNPGHAGDAQTGRHGDFAVGTTVYHVTAAPSRGVIAKCEANLTAGLHPVLLVPRELVSKAVHFAEIGDLDKRISVLAIEDFVAVNIMELSEGQAGVFIATLKGIIESYNRRLAEVETDLSLKIEVE